MAVNDGDSFSKIKIALPFAFVSHLRGGMAAGSLQRTKVNPIEVHKKMIEKPNVLDSGEVVKVSNVWS